MAEIGEVALLPVLRRSERGVFLGAGELGEVLLPANELTLEKVAEELEVFLYRDSEDRPIATLARPDLLPGQIGVLTVKDCPKVGAFLDWGLSKDILLPFREQLGRPKVGEQVVVHIGKDRATDRIIASQRLERVFSKKRPPFQAGEKVNLLIYSRTDLGFKAVVNGAYGGLIFSETAFRKLRFGQEMEGYVKAVRADGKIDLTLQAPGRDGVQNLETIILDELSKRGGFWAMDDSTPADEVHAELGVSKKLFKKATGALYRARKIVFADGGIRSVS